MRDKSDSGNKPDADCAEILSCGSWKQWHPRLIVVVVLIAKFELRDDE